MSEMIKGDSGKGAAVSSGSRTDMSHEQLEVTADCRLNWETLYGSGKGLWDEDAQNHVDGLREDR